MGRLTVDQVYEPALVGPAYSLLKTYATFKRNDGTTQILSWDAVVFQRDRELWDALAVLAKREIAHRNEGGLNPWEPQWDA